MLMPGALTTEHVTGMTKVEVHRVRSLLHRHYPRLSEGGDCHDQVRNRDRA
jgi:hypothetical protein